MPLSPRLLVLSAILALGACRSAAPAPEPVSEPQPRGPVYRYVARIHDLPDGCHDVRLSAPLPTAGADLHARLLVGNAWLELAPEKLASPPAEGAGVVPTWSWTVNRSDANAHLEVESAGKPIEVELRFAVADETTDASTLEAALSGDTRAEVDGAAWSRVETRLARVK